MTKHIHPCGFCGVIECDGDCSEAKKDATTMIDRSKLLALAEAVVNLTGPDRETDAAIFEAVYGFPEQAYQQRNGMRSKGSPPLDRMTWLTGWGVSAYTASLDAAMTLVPEGQFLRFYADGAQAIVVRPFSGSWLEVSRSFGVSNAAVVAAAALRAQAEALA